MTKQETSREFWRGMLVAGGLTAIPRWTFSSAAGVAEHNAAIPVHVAAALRRLAEEVDAPLGSMLLTAHAKALAALAGEREVVVGHLGAASSRPAPCRMTIETETGRDETWRALLLNVRRREAELLSHDDVAVDDLRRELGVAGPSFETVFDATGARGEIADGAVLQVAIVERGGPLVLRLIYRTEAIDADYVARIAGYHLAALTRLAQDPDGRHARVSLLSAAELEFQLDGLSGPRRELPDRRFHELFEERAKARPDDVAAEHGDLRWTYRELNARANRLGRALLERGLGRESVVAVVTKRNLDWMAAVLAVFKAGGVYLPIEPHFPADRIAATLSRAGCGLALTEAGAAAALDQALGSLPAVQRLLIEDAYREDHDDGDLGVEVAPDQLAYIYFTSGSTGAPKGAMCEHAGMLNHLYAKIDDLRIGEGMAVAQTAPQCFDISLWQLVSALLVGGRTLLIEQETILDVERFVDRLVEARVAVVQVVPSYLEVVASYLERRPRAFPDLICVSVTGEALTMELTRRWFAVAPGIRLVNAYGLTETSDDTNHEVMDRAPDGERVPLGRPVNNVRVYVLDEGLRPAPLGAPGEIVFSGVCVGRGYVNDPDRTRLAFMSDPYRDAERLYRSGDQGRWLPDGKLEFLGRKDTQVKIRGFRIEIGEIENALLRMAGVRHAAVVVSEAAGGRKRLVAFHSGGRIEADAVRERLGRSLPDYMIPSVVHWRDELPLTANGKIDRKTLTALAGELAEAGETFDAPNTPAERRIAAAWAKTLAIPESEVGRRDHFFDRGGTSLSAVKLVIALDRAVSLKDVTRNPVLTDLARLIGGEPEPRSGLLQAMSAPGGAETAGLVCFPYAGGNAVNFEPLARALRGGGLAVYAVELPGHDLAVDSEPFAPFAEVVERAAAEIAGLGLAKVLLWGHSAGAAFAIETARRLEAHGVAVERVFLAAQLLGDAAGRRRSAAELDRRGDAEIAAGLSADGGYAALDELDAERARRVGAAYRHDLTSACRSLADALDAPPAKKLAAPVTVMVAADDPSTADYPSRYADWRTLAEHVELRALDQGGHYFLRTRPTAAAEAALGARAPAPAATSAN